MTTTLAAPTQANKFFPAHPKSATATSRVLTISGMPVKLRRRVETLMADYLPPAEVDITPGTDIWDLQWFTRWKPDTTVFGARGVSCREVLTAPANTLEEFSAQLQLLAQHYGFHAAVTQP